MQNTNPSTISSIVLLRGIAALWVCFIHLGMIAGYQGSGIINAIIKEGANWVAIFFVISGFILPYSLYKNQYQINSFFNFLFRRSIRIDPPYWMSIILTFGLTTMAFGSLSFFDILLHLTYAVPFVKGAHWYNDVYWTLSIEFQFYILLGLFYPMLMRLNPKLTSAILILITFFFVSVVKFDHRGIIFTNFYDFVFGFILFLGYVKKINSKLLFAIILSLSAYIMVSVSIKTGFMPLATSGFIFFYKKKERMPALSFLGDISYSLYLIHIPVAAYFVSLVHPFLGNGGSLFITTVVICILFAYLYNQVIERPSIKLSKLIPLKNNKASRTSDIALNP